MEEPNIQPQKPIQSAIEDLQKNNSRSFSIRQSFFDTLKEKYPNFHTFYVFFNIVATWAGSFTIIDSWAGRLNLLQAPTPKFEPEILLRYISVLVLGLIMLLLDDLSLKELIFGRKTPSEKPVKAMNFREKLFHNFKNNYPNLSTIYTLIAILLCWCGLFGFFYNIPLQPLFRAILLFFGGLFLLYIDDMKLDEL
ncbi:MAG: hypothetical protein WBB28_09070 [Crinalium sp.]